MVRTSEAHDCAPWVCTQMHKHKEVSLKQERGWERAGVAHSR